MRTGCADCLKHRLGWFSNQKSRLRCRDGGGVSVFLFGDSNSCIHQQSPCHWSQGRGRRAYWSWGRWRWRCGSRSQGGGGDLLHPPPLGQSGTTNWFQDWGDVPVKRWVSGRHCTLEQKDRAWIQRSAIVIMSSCNSFQLFQFLRVYVCVCLPPWPGVGHPVCWGYIWAAGLCVSPRGVAAPGQPSAVGEGPRAASWTPGPEGGDRLVPHRLQQWGKGDVCQTHTLASLETEFQYPPVRENFPLPIRARISSGVSSGPLAKGVKLESKTLILESYLHPRLGNRGTCW